LRILVIHAHPVETSFVASLHRTAVETLRRGGHEVDDCDLYGEGFDPVMSRQERIDYHDVGRNRARIAADVARLKAAEGLLFVYPVWNFGFPAILKGYLDRVWVPGVAFDIDARGNLSRTLRHIRRLGAICTYGGERWRAMLMSDPPRRSITRMIRAHVARGAPCDYLASYNMNHTTVPRRAAFLRRVDARLSAW
jgi:putative NADPH-quinone reductase